MPKGTKYSREDVEREIPNARSYRDLLIRLGMCGDGGGAVYLLRRKVAEWGLDDSHFTGQGWLRGKTHNFTQNIPLSEILVESSNYANRASLKRRLLKEGLLEEICAECGLPPEWHEKKLVLVLDHINGVRDDHRLENLRLLCPNCNSQQPTFAGRNIGKPG